MRNYIFNLFWLLLLMSSCSTANEKKEETKMTKIVLEESLEWDELEKFITHFKDSNSDLDKGKKEMIAFINTNYPSFDTKFLNHLNLHNFKKEFIDWVKVPLTREKPDTSVSSLYFGLFSSSVPELTSGLEETKVLYVAGSSTSPLVDPDDWAVDPAYFPEARYYYVPDEFIHIESELKKYEDSIDVEQIIYNSIMNLILVNSKVELRELVDSNVIYLGSGFDEGNAFFLGEL